MKPHNPGRSGNGKDSVRWLSFFTEVRRDELRATLLFFLTAFLMLAAYYIIRALREGFILVDFGADARSMAVGVVTLILMVVVPLYSKLRYRFGSNRLVFFIFAFFTANLVLFYLAWSLQWQIGFVFFVWVGLFGLMVVSQFWAMANGSWDEDAGKRLFPFIMIGANLGALAGTEVADIAASHHGMHGLMMIGISLMAVVTLLLPACWRTAPGRPAAAATCGPRPSMLGGFSVVASDRYLVLMALTIVLLNWINSTGEYLFAHFVELHAATELPAAASHDQRAEYVTHVYANFMLWYTALGLLMQTFVVSRLFRWIGVGRSALILPVLIMFSYLLIAFVPIFTLIRFVKIAENAVDYSLMSTVRQALFLPTSEEAKFDGKTAIDTFFWRIGDLVQAAMVYAGVHWLGWEVRGFAIAALMLSVLFLLSSAALAREYRRRVPDDGLRVDYRMTVAPGGAIDMHLPSVLTGLDAGSLGSIAAYVDGGQPLPGWLGYDSVRHRLQGETPGDFRGVLKLRVDAGDAPALKHRYSVAIVALPGE